MNLFVKKEHYILVIVVIEESFLYISEENQIQIVPSMSSWELEHGLAL